MYTSNNPTNQLKSAANIGRAKHKYTVWERNRPLSLHYANTNG